MLGIGLKPAFMRLCVCPCANTFKQEYLGDQRADRNQTLSETLLWWGLPALGFESDRIITLVSMATDSSHRGMMGEM